MSRGTRERHHRAPAAALATGRMARPRRLLALLAVAATPATAPTPNPVAPRRWRARRTSTESGPEEPFALSEGHLPFPATSSSRSLIQSLGP